MSESQPGLEFANFSRKGAISTISLMRRAVSLAHFSCVKKSGSGVRGRSAPIRIEDYPPNVAENQIFMHRLELGN